MKLYVGRLDKFKHQPVRRVGETDEFWILFCSKLIYLELVHVASKSVIAQLIIQDLNVLVGLLRTLSLCL